jgi:hypothetical protein
MFLLEKDFNDFSGFLPTVFTYEYVAGVRQKIDEVNNLLNPNSETIVLKDTTNRMYLAMDGLIEPAGKVTAYIKYTKGAVPVSVKDFGLTALKQKIYARDAEGVLKNLRTVIANLEKFRPQLSELGLDDDTFAVFNNALTNIETDNQRQFEIVNKRKTIVENNVTMINDLYKTIIDVCNIGKAIYKGKNDSKVKDYTFKELKKKVRVN